MAGKQEAEVVFEYEKTQDDELSLKVGDIIQDVVQADEGWCEGTLNGVRGMFPDNFVKLRPAQTTPAPAPIAQPPVTTRGGGGSIKKRRAKVAFSYAAENADELTLQPGQIVEVLAEEEEGWFRGRLDGKEGVFPSNFLDPNSLAESTQPASEPARPEETPATKPMIGHKLFPSINPAAALAGLRPSGGDKEKKAPPTVPPPAEKKAPPTVPPPVEKKAPPTVPPPAEKKPSERARVTYEYKAENEDELTISQGDIVEIVAKDTDQDGWWKVRLGDKVGLIPDNFVEVLPPSATPSAHPPTKTKPPPPMPTNNKPPPARETHPPPGKPHPPRSGSMSRPAPPQPDRPLPPSERATPQVKEESPEDNPDFGVPHTDPLDSTIVKDRPKRTSRPPSRSNLQTGDTSEPTPDPKPDKPAAAQNTGLSPWQAELQKRKANKPPPPTPGTRPTPATKKAAVKPPEKSVVKPPPSKPQTSNKPQVEPAPPPTRDSPSPLSPPAPSTITPTQHLIVAPPSDNSWKEAYEKLREDHEKLRDDFEKFKLAMGKQFAVLTSDLDDERKHWRGLEVDIDRLKKQCSLPK